MRIIWKEENLDLILVPSGLFVMFGYHLFLLYRYLRNPKTTVLGFENHCKKAWVKMIMQIESTSRGPAFNVISSSISASTCLASVSLGLGSLIVTWMGSASSNALVTQVIYGDTRTSITSIKYIALLVFFLMAFTAFVQSSRSYVHANFLLSMPRAEVPEEFVMEALIHGANYWQIGLRGIYFALTLLFWVFGPIPMFVSSAASVVVLYTLDVNKKPLHAFHTKDVFLKIGEGITSVGTAVKHQERHGSEVRASVTKTVVSSTTTATT